MRKRDFHRRTEMIVSMVVVGLIGLITMLFRTGKGTFLYDFVEEKVGEIGYTAVVFQAPSLYVTTNQEESLLKMIENRLLSTYPLFTCGLEQEVKMTYLESPLYEEMMLVEGAEEEIIEIVEEEPMEEEEATPALWQGNLAADEEAAYPLSTFGNYQKALDTFYHVDSTTMMGEDLLNVKDFLSRDMTVDMEGDGPKILIYHTHSQEGYSGSDKTVTDLGDVLTTLLTEKYGMKVLHHKGEYDVSNRDYAYSNALPEISQIIKDNPSIEVIIDLHRDGVGEGTHLVTTLDGKQVAQIMFFNGVSQTKKNGKISYLTNENLQDNLAFSFQMQLAAKTYYPTLTRDIYIKGYRYNMHLLPKTLLVEVGAQTNTYEEACNSMTYLAELLYRVLAVKR